MAMIGIAGFERDRLAEANGRAATDGNSAVGAELRGDLARFAGALDRDVHLGAVMDTGKSRSPSSAPTASA